ncbi:survival protein sure-likephosphatase/nucleotidase-like protein [Cercophora newfieldiana]|uniref:Survival protein sure-likephosphatase/nucleotidase-like protein n=1 Tax=Cercophora newfieldiana TaxID=92897 RepID=A0AA39Y752_9PEZI|nr:survival protein sure-likephosphatase/nucleotidase-like protein [Cercophora newfieldiana]
MRTTQLLVGLVSAATLGAHGLRVIQSNDDGWAELYVRSFHDALLASGHNAVLSGPAENRSGTGSTDSEPSPRTSPCQYDSCVPSSAPIGTNLTSPRLNWVNSFPVTAMRYGISTIGPQLWHGAAPDLAVAGPNVGSNLYLQVHFSGTVGAAVYAAKTARIPAIAFSGASSGTLAWNTNPVPVRSTVYAQLATKLVNALTAGGKPYLPEDVWLNVNFPEVNEECNQVGDFKWVLSRINVGVFSQPDAQICGKTRLPTETEVILKKGCYVSVSVGDAADKSTADAERQAVVARRLTRLLECLP